jgi:hypothetical protein
MNARTKNLLRGAWMAAFGIALGVALGLVSRHFPDSPSLPWIVLAALMVLSAPFAMLSVFVSERLRWRREARKAGE